MVRMKHLGCIEQRAETKFFKQDATTYLYNACIAKINMSGKESKR